MQISEQQLLIDKAVRNELTAGEQKKIAQLCESDVSFQEQYQLEMELSEALAEDHLSDLRQKIWEVVTTKEVPKTSNITWLWRAAAVLVVVMCSFWLMNELTGSASNSELVAQHFEPYPIIGVVRGNTEVDSLQTTGFKAYSEERYDDAITSFNLLEQSPEPDAMLHLYLGVSQLATENAQAALVSFKKIPEAHPVFSTAQWYVALAYLQMDEKENATTVLRKLSNGNSRASQQANHLLLEMK